MQPPAGGAGQTSDSKDTSSSGPPAQRLYLSSLPPNIAKALAVYDTNFDGILGENEVALAAADMEHMQNIVEQEKEGKIPLDFFPEPVRKILCEFDANSDGELDVVEIMHGFEALKRERKRRRQLVWVLIGLLVFTVILLGAIGGLMAWIVESSKQTKIDDTVMMVKGGAEAVRTSSAEYAVVDGVMMARGDPEQSCTDGQCSQPLKLSQALQSGALSSQVSDQDLEELRQMKIGNEGSWISFQVFAVARYQDADSEFGSIVAIYTHLGEIYLNGQEVTFHESLEGAFTRAGFSVDGSRRRLLGVVEVLGLFNFLRQNLAGSAINNITSILQGIPTYNGVVSRFTVCESPAANGCKFIGDGPWVNHIASYKGQKALMQSEEQHLYSIGEQPYSITIETKDQYPAQQRYIVRNATHKLTFQKYKNKYYHCKMEQSDALATLTGAGESESVAEGVKVSDPVSVDMEDADGNTVPCMKWTIEIEATSYVVDYYQTIGDSPRIFQMDVANEVYRFDSIEFTASNQFGSLGDAPAELNLEATSAACDPLGIIKPYRMSNNEVSHIIAEDPRWGEAAVGAPAASQSTNTKSFDDFKQEKEQLLENYCLNKDSSGEIFSGVGYNVSEYGLCSNSSQGGGRRSGGGTVTSTTVTVALNDATDGQAIACEGERLNGDVISSSDCECFEGSGSVDLVKTCNQFGDCNFEVNGNLALTFKTYKCYRGFGTLLADKALEHMGGEAGLNIDVGTTVNNALRGVVARGSSVIYENPTKTSGASCPSQKFGGIGGSPDYYCNYDINQNLPFEQLQHEFRNSAGQLIMRVGLVMTMDIMILPIPACSAGQQSGGFPSSNQQLGFRLGLHIESEVAYYISPLGTIRTTPFQTFFVETKRRVFPPNDGADWCERGNTGASPPYHFKADLVHTEPWWETPLGLIDVVGSPCVTL